MSSTEYAEEFPTVTTTRAIREVEEHGMRAKVRGDELLLIEEGFEPHALKIANGRVSTGDIFDWLGY